MAKKFTPKKRKMIIKKDLELAIDKQGGLITYIANSMGFSRQAIHKAIKRFKLEDKLQEARDKVLDLAESKLIEEIQNGNLLAIIFYLKTIGKKRGYIQKQELEADVQQTIHTIYKPYVPNKVE